MQHKVSFLNDFSSETPIAVASIFHNSAPGGLGSKNNSNGSGPKIKTVAMPMGGAIPVPMLLYRIFSKKYGLA